LKIDWEETTSRMRQAGFTEEEIEEVKKNPVAGTARFLDEERGVPICVRYRGLIVELEQDKVLQTVLKSHEED
jgi:hypothetical protein